MIGGLGAPPYTCKVIYLDNNATTMPLAEVVDAMRESLVSNWGNPSSVHRFGQAARAQLEQAREHVAQLAGCTEREIIFCSSGTESAALALRGVLQAHATRRLIVTSKLEHAAVRNLAQHLEDAGTCEVIWVEHAPSGEIHFDHLRSVVQKRAHEIALVSLMSVNNETGVTLAVREVGELCRKSGVLFHSDVTQSVGRENFDVVNSMVDFATFSAHKLHGPKGAAALFARRGAGIVAQLVGGPQVINGISAARVWNTTNIAFAHLEAEAILLALSNAGVCASAGAACSSGSLDPSPVLLAMGVAPVLAHGSVRFSLSRFTTQEEIARAATIVCDCIRQLRARTGAAVNMKRPLDTRS